MKKFNVPTQMDVILQLITSSKCKPHLFMRKGKYIADIKCGFGRVDRITYSPEHSLITASFPLFRPAPGQPMQQIYAGWDEVYHWAKRVNANRYTWDK